MKKSIFLSVLAVLAAAVSVSVYMKNENPMDELFEANVEALAGGENFDRMCIPNAVLGSEYYVLCSTCRPGRTSIYSYSFCDL